MRCIYRRRPLVQGTGPFFWAVPAESVVENGKSQSKGTGMPFDWDLLFPCILYRPPLLLVCPTVEGGANTLSRYAVFPGLFCFPKRLKSCPLKAADKSSGSMGGEQAKHGMPIRATLWAAYSL